MRRETPIAAVWAVFATAMTVCMFELPGEETIPYHLIWASFALLYGFYRWPKSLTRPIFAAIVVATGVPLIKHATSGVIGWEECSEIVLMAFIVGLAVWQVDSYRSASDRVEALTEADRERVRKQDLATRTGSHEVLTRLTIARGFAELIHDQSPEPQIQADARVVLTELDKASAMAREVLTLVRFDSPDALQSVDVDELLRQIIKRWSGAAVRDWRIESNVGTFIADPERLEAALDALLENAVKFTETASTIELRARRDGGNLLLAVSDHGMGIPEADLHRIFDVFQTGSTAGERAGSGIGLAIVLAAVTPRGGSVEVSSRPGAGSTFTMKLPALKLIELDSSARPIAIPSDQGARDNFSVPLQPTAGTSGAPGQQLAL